jgi:hypothetical protein
MKALARILLAALPLGAAVAEVLGPDPHRVIGEAAGIAVGIPTAYDAKQHTYTVEVEAWLKPLPEEKTPASIQLDASPECPAHSSFANLTLQTKQVIFVYPLYPPVDGSWHGLQHCSPDLREKEILRLLSPEHTDALLLQAEAPGDDPPRAEAIRHLGELRCERALDLLVRRALSSDPAHYASSYAALSALYLLSPEKARSVYLRVLSESDNPRRVMEVASLLSHSPIPQAETGRLLDAFRKWDARRVEERFVQADIVAALGALERSTPEVESLLLGQISSGPDLVRHCAMIAAGRLGLQAAVPRLFEAVEEKGEDSNAADSGLLSLAEARGFTGWFGYEGYSESAARRALKETPELSGEWLSIRKAHCFVGWAFRVKYRQDGEVRRAFYFVGNRVGSDGKACQTVVRLYP